MAFGITPEGFVPKTTADVLTQVQSDQAASIDPNLDMQPTNPLGVMNGIVAGAVGEVWELGSELYDGMDPDVASDDQLTSVCLLTGTKREAAQPTQVVACDVNVDGGFSALAGTMFANIVGDATAIFVNKEDVSNPGGSPADFNIDFVAINTGPQQALAGTLTVIAQALAGWNSITNPNDGVIGNNGEADADLRLRRDQELAAAGQFTPAAIRSAILEASQNGVFSALVVSCAVLFNDSDATDSNGLPPHSFECVVYQPGATPDDDQALAELIAVNKGGGMNAWGGTSKTVTDSQGFPETIRFTRPQTLRMYVAIQKQTITGYAGDTALKEALANYGNKIGAGGEVVIKHLQAQAFTVPGLFDVLAFTVDVVFPAVGTVNILVDVREVPTFSTADITVT